MKLIPQDTAPPRTVYRHFAIVTVVATLALAGFASGENHEATPGASATAATPAPAAERKKATLAVKGDGQASIGGWGQANDPDFASLGESGYASNLQSLQPQLVPASYKGNLVSDAVLAMLSPEERDALLRQMHEAESASSLENQRSRIDALEAASAARAGGLSDD